MNSTMLNICHESIVLLIKTHVAHFSHVAFCYKENCFINAELHEGITPLGAKAVLLPHVFLLSNVRTKPLKLGMFSQT